MFSNWMFLLFGVSLLKVSEAIECPNLWVSFDGECYRFTEQSMTFIEAEHYCQQHNSHLVHIESAAENNFLKEEISQLIATHWWIGVSDLDIEGTFVWYGTNAALEFTDWFPGNPSDSAGHEDCGEIIKWAGHGIHWNDVNCHNMQPAICELVGNEGSVIG